MPASSPLSEANRVAQRVVIRYCMLLKVASCICCSLSLVDLQAIALRIPHCSTRHAAGQIKIITLLQITNMFVSPQKPWPPLLTRNWSHGQVVQMTVPLLHLLVMVQSDLVGYASRVDSLYSCSVPCRDQQCPGRRQERSCFERRPGTGASR